MSNTKKAKPKRLLSLFLALTMVLGMLPAMSITAAAYTAGDIEGTTGTGTVEDPVVCDTLDEFKAPMENTEIICVKLTGASGAMPSRETLGAAISNTTYKVLTIEGTNQFWSPLDGNNDCPLYTAPAVAACTCGAAEGEPHAEECPLYTAPAADEDACTCGAAKGEPHAEDCPLYTAPAAAEDVCTCGAAEGEPHAEDCPLYAAADLGVVSGVGAQEKKAATFSADLKVDDDVRMYYSSNIYKHQYYKNGSGCYDTDDGEWNIYFDVENEKLYLKNYDGGPIVVSQSSNQYSQLNIVLIGDNTITVNDSTTYDAGITFGEGSAGLIITSESGGTLTIDANRTDDSDVYGIVLRNSYCAIQGDAQVIINATGNTSRVSGIHNNVDDGKLYTFNLYGSASLTITAKSTSSQANVGYVWGIYTGGISVKTDGHLNVQALAPNSPGPGVYNALYAGAGAVHLDKASYIRLATQHSSPLANDIGFYSKDTYRVNGMFAYNRSAVGFYQGENSNDTYKRVFMWQMRKDSEGNLKTPRTLTLTRGTIAAYGTPDGQFFEGDVVEIKAKTSNLTYDPPFTKWTYSGGGSVSIPSSAETYYYMADADGAATAWYNVFSNIVYLPSATSSGSGGITFDACGNARMTRLVREDVEIGEAIESGDVLTTIVGDFTETKVPAGWYRLAAKIDNMGDDFFISERIYVYYEPFSMNPIYYTEAEKIEFKVEPSLIPTPQVDLYQYGSNTLVAEDVHSGDVVPGLQRDRKYVLKYTWHERDYKSVPFLVPYKQAEMFPQKPALSLAEPTSNYGYGDRLRITYNRVVTSTQPALVKSGADPSVDENLYAQGSCYPNMLLNHDVLPEGKYQLALKTVSEGNNWYVHPAELWAMYSPWGTWNEDYTRHTGGMPGCDENNLLTFTWNRESIDAFGMPTTWMLERKNSEGVWVQYGRYTNFASGTLDLSGAACGLYRMKAVYGDNALAPTFCSQEFYVLNKYIFSSEAPSIVWQSSSQVRVDFTLSGILEELGVTEYTIAAYRASDLQKVANAANAGSTAVWVNQDALTPGDTSDDLENGAECVLGVTVNGRTYYSDSFTVDFREPPSFSFANDPYELPFTGSAGIEYYYRLINWRGDPEGLTFSLGEDAPEWLTIGANGETIGEIRGTPPRGGTYRFTVVLENAAGRAEHRFTLNVEAPIEIYPDSGYSFVGTIMVQFYSSNSGYEIWYTTDGSAPGRNGATSTKADGIWGPTLGAEMTDNQTVTVNAVQFDTNGNQIAGVVSATYKKVAKPEAPTASRPSGSFAGAFDLELACGTSEVVVLYTLDGSDPTVPTSGSHIRYCYSGGEEAEGANLSTKEYDDEGNWIRSYNYKYEDGAFLYNHTNGSGYPFPVGKGAADGETVTVKAVAYQYSWSDAAGAYQLGIPSEVVTFTYTKTTGFSLTGTVTGYNNAEGLRVRLYPDDADDAAVKADVKKAAGEIAGALDGTTADTITADGDGKRYHQNFGFEGVTPGFYKMAVYKPGHAVSLVTVDLTVGSQTKSLTLGLMGDVNGDGVVNSKDVTRLRQHLKVSCLSEEEQNRGNVNGDNALNSKDVTRLRQHVKTPSLYPFV